MRQLSLWRNRLARSAVNRKVGGSSPPRDVNYFAKLVHFLLSSISPFLPHSIVARFTLIAQFSLYLHLLRLYDKITDASAGNRTRAARVAGEHSTTEPPMLLCMSSSALK